MLLFAMRGRKPVALIVAMWAIALLGRYDEEMTIGTLEELLKARERN